MTSTNNFNNMIPAAEEPSIQTLAPYHFYQSTATQQYLTWFGGQDYFTTASQTGATYGVVGDRYTSFLYLSTGTYAVNISRAVGPNRGAGQIYVDEVSIGSVPCSNASYAKRLTCVTTSLVITQSKIHKIEFVQTGAGSGGGIDFSFITFIKMD